MREENFKIDEARASDCIKLCERQNCIKSTDFLSPEAAQQIKKNCDLRFSNTLFWGGYDGAERTVFSAYPDYMDAESAKKSCGVAAIEIKSSSFSSLTHRDYLGALLSLGTSRAVLGDICITDDGAAVFVKEEIADFILNNLTKIGKSGVSVKLIDAKNLKINEAKYETAGVFVASYRADAVIAAVLNLSRAQAQKLILSEAVKVNHITETDGAKLLKCCDLVSVRGYGRFALDFEGGKSRRGKTYISVKKYI